MTSPARRSAATMSREDGLHLGQIRRLLEEHLLRGLGIAEDDAERLVQLVGQRAGQHAHRVHARQVHQVVAQFPGFRFRLLLRGDIANHAEGADRAPGGVAPGDTAHVMDPLLPLGRMQVAILDRDPVEPPLVQLLTLVQHPLAVVRMQMLHPELQGLEALQLVRGNAADLAETVRRRSRYVRQSSLRSTRGRPDRFPPRGGPRWRETPPRHVCAR